ncbi:MFS transporter [Laceyella tengchongensis]|uniref:MFS transporter n=1 Tax=Laceyella tengchongensis TaxID=574699 RepID=UPI0012B7F7C3|nr:MFS transporter [Laceyella tengchongensis]
MKYHFTGKQWWILLLIFSGTLINAIDRSSLATASPYIAQELHLDMSTMGLVLSSFGWTYLLCNLPSGWLVDRFGAKRVYGWAATLWSVACAMTGLARNVSTLLVSRTLVGIGESANFPVATKVVREHFATTERGLATGIYLAGLRLGYAVTPGLMAWLMLTFGSDARPDWQSAFLATGLGGLGFVLIWFATYQEHAPLTSKPTSPTASTLILLKHRNTWAILIIKFLQDYLYYLYLTWLPMYFVTERHLSLTSVAFYVTIPWVAGMIAQPLAGLTSDFFIIRGHSPTKIKKFLLIITQLVAASVIFAAFVESVHTAAILLIIAMAAESASAAILWTLPQDIAPEKLTGQLGGLMNTAGAAAAIVSPILTGLVAEIAGFAAALTLGGICMLISVLTIAFLLGPIRPIGHS